MEMKFSDYIANPMGKANSVFSGREMYKNLYTEKFNKLMVRENAKIDYELYKDGDNYIAYIKVPSETVKNFYYDVVVYLYQKDKKLLGEKNLENYYVKFYSNDPSFVYTFAHAFRANGLLFEDLNPRMSKQSLRQVAKERNPKDEVGYVKSLYFAYLIMKNKGLFNKIHYVTASKYNKKDLLNKVMDADEKIRLRREQEPEEKKEKKPDAKIKDKNDNSGETEQGIGIRRTKITNSVKKVNTVRKIKVVKKK